MEYTEFEKNGLKIDNERVLTYSKLSCPFDCTYCFVDGMTQEQESRGNTFSFSVSIPCFSEKSLTKYEPKAPSPQRRIKTLQNVFNEGIPTMVAIRPLLPDIEENELEKIVNLTKDFVIGYYSGPLYLKQDKLKILLPNFEIKQDIKPHWMLDGNYYQEVVREGQMEFLASLIQKSGKQFFTGATEGVEFIKKVKGYDQSRN
ncbi:hypothetical protein HYV69_04225 [Candidatus Uhrbacteria bacterium]|nr:hypothetical protein [Candidatus Uhrbacteria bacterium]